MSRRCSVSNKGNQFGHRVSHANNKTKHAFAPNLQTKRIFVPELGKTVRLRISTRIIRTIDKIGLLETLRKNGLSLKDVTA
jgi:large subunit ribosomal protein L28